MEPTLRVLCVEDSDDDFRLVSRALAHGLGPCHTLRVDSREAIESALQGPPWDVVLSDHAVAGLQVSETVALLARHGSSAPLLVVSGRMDASDRRAARRAGARAVVEKSALHRLPQVVQRVQATERSARALAGLLGDPAGHALVLERLLDAAADAVLVVDQADVVGWCSPGGTALLGESGASPIGQALAVLVPSLDRRAAAVRPVAAVLTDGSPSGRPVRVRTAALPATTHAAAAVMVWAVGGSPQPGAGDGAIANVAGEGALHAAAAAGAALARDLEDLAAVVDGYGRLARAALSPLHPARRHLARARLRAGHLREQVRRLVVPATASAGEGPLTPAALAERAASRLRAAVGRPDTVRVVVGRHAPPDSPPDSIDGDALDHALRIVVDGVAPALRDSAQVRCLVEERPGTELALGVEGTGDLRLDLLDPHWLDAEPLLAAVARDAPLGLAALRWLCDQLGASVSYEQPQPSQARWWLALPARGTDRPERGPYGTELVLLVHGEPGARRRLKHALSAYGYRAVGATGAEAARRLLDRCGGRVALVCFDLDDRVASAAAADPALLAAAGACPRLLLQTAATPGPEAPGASVLRKPVPPRTLAWRVRRLLDEARS